MESTEAAVEAPPPPPPPPPDLTKPLSFFSIFLRTSVTTNSSQTSSNVRDIQLTANGTTCGIRIHANAIILA